MESTETAWELYQASGQRFARHFLAQTRIASNDLRPGSRWARVKHDPVAASQASIHHLEQAAISNLEQEWPNLRLAIEEAHARQDWLLVCQLADELTVFFNLRSYWADWVQTAEMAATDSTLTADLRVQAEALNNLGVVYLHLERLSEASEYSQRSLAISRQLGDRYNEALGLGNLGSVYFTQKNMQAAIECYEGALQLFKELDDEYGQASALMGLGISLARLHDYSGAVAKLEACLALQRQIEDRFGQGQTLNNLGIIQQQQGQIPEALASFQSSLQIKRELGDQQGIANTLNNMANAYQKVDALDQAIEAWEEALALIYNLHPGAAERVTLQLERARRKRETM